MQDAFFIDSNSVFCEKIVFLFLHVTKFYDTPANCLLKTGLFFAVSCVQHYYTV